MIEIHLVAARAEIHLVAARARRGGHCIVVPEEDPDFVERPRILDQVIQILDEHPRAPAVLVVARELTELARLWDANPLADTAEGILGYLALCLPECAWVVEVPEFPFKHKVWQANLAPSAQRLWESFVLSESDQRTHELIANYSIGLDNLWDGLAVRSCCRELARNVLCSPSTPPSDPSAPQLFVTLDEEAMFAATSATQAYLAGGTAIPIASTKLARAVLGESAPEYDVHHSFEDLALELPGKEKSEPGQPDPWDFHHRRELLPRLPVGNENRTVITSDNAWPEAIRKPLATVMAIRTKASQTCGDAAAAPLRYESHSPPGILTRIAEQLMHRASHLVASPQLRLRNAPAVYCHDAFLLTSSTARSLRGATLAARESHDIRASTEFYGSQEDDAEDVEQRLATLELECKKMGEKEPGDNLDGQAAYLAAVRDLCSAYDQAGRPAARAMASEALIDTSTPRPSAFRLVPPPIKSAIRSLAGSGLGQTFRTSWLVRAFCQLLQWLDRLPVIHGVTRITRAILDPPTTIRARGYFAYLATRHPLWILANIGTPIALLGYGTETVLQIGDGGAEHLVHHFVATLSLDIPDRPNCVSGTIIHIVESMTGLALISLILAHFTNKSLQS